MSETRNPDKENAFFCVWVFYSLIVRTIVNHWALVVTCWISTTQSRIHTERYMQNLECYIKGGVTGDGTVLNGVPSNQQNGDHWIKLTSIKHYMIISRYWSSFCRCEPSEFYYWVFLWAICMSMLVCWYAWTYLIIKSKWKSW